MRNIILGDCLEVMRTYPDNHFDWVITDPPYGIKEHGGKVRYGTQAKARGFKTHKHYDNHDWDNETPSQEYFDEIFRVSKNQLIFGMNYFNLPPTKSFIVWHKKGTDRSSFADCELIWSSDGGSAKLFAYPWVGFGYINNPDKERKQHPTQKPQRLMRHLIETYTKEGDLILDPFAGSGSTLVASQALNRECIGVEKNQQYVDITVNRLTQESNK